MWRFEYAARSPWMPSRAVESTKSYAQFDQGVIKKGRSYHVPLV